MSTKKEIRVFISSTFKDLDEERAYLAKHTFPLLRAYCNRRGVHFSEIDLRWGVTEEESKNGRVLRLCLSQIEECQPFFIGILGNRYGWIPTLLEVQKDRQLTNEYPDILTAITDHKSVVEIEFDYGMLRDPKRDFQFVYTKQQEKQHPRVGELIERVKSKDVLITDFASLEELHTAVLSNLERAIEKYLEEFERVWEDEDQLAFMTERLRSYIEHATYTEQIEEVLAKDRSTTIFTGESGSGKSALTAHTIDRLRTREKRIVLGHFIGASSASRNARGIFDHLSSQLQHNYNVDLGSTSTFGSLQDEYAFLFSRISEKGAIVVLDALDQLDEDSQPLDWLPEYLPENTHLFVSTTPGSALKRLRQREWDEIAMEPFDREEREAFIVRYLSDYGKRLEHSHVTSLASNPKCRNPLFLKMLLEEVRLSAHFIDLEETIDHNLSVKNLDGLFQLMLTRIESEYGEYFVSNILGSIAVSHNGLSVTELSTIAGVPLLAVQQFSSTYAHLLIRSEEKLAVFHDSLNRALTARYAETDDIMNTRKLAVLNALRSTSSDVRMVEELLPQALDLNDHELVIEVLSDPNSFKYIAGFGEHHRSIALFARLFNQINIAEIAETLIEQWNRKEMEVRDRVELFYTLSNLLLSRAELIQSAKYAELALSVALSADNWDDLRLQAKLRNTLGTALEELGQLDKAAEHYSAAMEAAKEAQDLELEFDALQNEGILEYQRGNSEKALAIFQKALNTYGDRALYSEHMIGSFSNIGAVLYRMWRFSEAEVYFSKALTYGWKLYGDDDPRLGLTYNNLGVIHIYTGKYGLAVRDLNKALSQNLKLYGEYHLSVADNYLSLGRAHLLQKQYTLAIEQYENALRIRTRLLPHDHPAQIEIVSMLSIALNEYGKYDKSIELVTTIKVNPSQQNSNQLSEAYIAKANAYLNLGKIQDAVRFIDNGILSFEAILPPDSPAIESMRKFKSEQIATYLQ